MTPFKDDDDRFFVVSSEPGRRCGTTRDTANDKILHTLASI
jgi:hypothetical protein